jgi:hypothetical protein
MDTPPEGEKFRREAFPLTLLENIALMVPKIKSPMHLLLSVMDDTQISGNAAAIR